MILSTLPVSATQNLNSTSETNTTEESSSEEIDFSSKRLIVRGSKKELKNEPVIADVDGVSLLQYESEEEAAEAYDKLSAENNLIEVDSSVYVAENSDTNPSDTEIMTEKENPFSEAEDIKVDKNKYDVAVIDTGANNADKIVSVLGDDGKDRHGHGQKMIDTIKTYAPDVKILSIKALGDGGSGDASAVYAAIRLAIDEKVDIINLSISALASENNFAIEEIIKEAESKGITSWSSW